MNILIQNLKAYPQLIFDREMKVMEAMTKKQNAKSDLDSYLLGVEDEISKNPELRNETMRKAAKKQLLSDDKNYQKLTKKLEQCDRHYRIAQFELDKAKNDFSVAKLEMKMAISLEQAA